ncbi:phosphatase 1 regulatory subunit [Thraustotheca clavata]|uniref:Phosphatase 1 regulatory subunit n=1 Tax=Thraustotheca clavata TaxID=74557 RepID=A0A1W0A5U6_9STRA|nr:phosphatase 1 regulatory subunit [Thraustotheca clavata]
MRDDFHSGFLLRGHAPKTKSIREINKEYANGSLFSKISTPPTPDFNIGAMRLFFILTPSRMDYYLVDPRPQFKQPIAGSFAFDQHTQVFDCSEVWPGLPSHTFCISTNGQNLVLSAKNHDEMSEWIRCVSKTLAAFPMLLRGVLLKKSTKYPRRAWSKRLVELGETCLSYSNIQPGAKNVRNHIRLTGHAFVCDFDDQKQYRHVFSLSSGHTTLVFSAMSLEEKQKWMTELEVRILRHRIQQLRNTKASDFAGYLDIRSAADKKWRRRYCSIHSGLFILKGQEKRMGTKSTIYLETILKITMDTPTSRTYSFTIQRFGAPDLYVAAYSETEKKKWLDHFHIARTEIKDAPSTAFEKDISAIVKTTGYITIHIQPHERLEMLIEQWHERIVVCNTVIAKRTVPRGSVLVCLKDVSGKHDTFDVMWHFLRIQTRPVTLTFRLPISKGGILRIHTTVPASQWVARHCSVMEGHFIAQSVGDDPEVLVSWPLRKCKVSLVHDYNTKLDDNMPNCFFIECEPLQSHNTENTTIILSAASSEDCVLWMAVLHLEISIAHGDPTFAPKSPTRADKRRISMLKQVKKIAEYMYGDDEAIDAAADAEGVVNEHPPPPAIEPEEDQSWRDKSDSDEDSDDQTLYEKLHQNLVVVPRKFIKEKRASCAEFVTTTYQTQRAAFLEREDVKEFLANAEKARVRVAPLAKAVRQRSRRFSRDCGKYVDEAKTAIRVPNPATNPLFDGSKRYITASIRGKSVKHIEQSSKRKTRRFYDCQPIVKRYENLPHDQTIETSDESELNQTTMSTDTARQFFDEVSNGKDKHPYLHMIELLRKLAIRSQVPEVACEAFENAIEQMEQMHEITFSISRVRFVQVATNTIHDSSLVESIQWFAKGHMLWIGFMMADNTPPAAPLVARVIEEPKPSTSESNEGKEKKELMLTECIEFRAEDEEIYHVGTAGLKARVLNGLEEMTKLRELHVRSNLLYKMTGIENLVNLTHLELYDNQIKKMTSLENLVNLRVLDLSFNEIRVIPDLSHLTKLEELYVANNKLTHITGIENLKTLKKLDLGANRLRTIEGLNHLENLLELWLGKNKITTIQGLENLTSLRIMSIQSNRLLTIENLEKNILLEELYLSHNGIEALANIELLTKLTILDVSNNRIKTIPSMTTNPLLEDLWLNDNLIDNFDQLQMLKTNTKLETLYLERNPIASDFEYRLKIQNTLPSVQKIDATPTKMELKRLTASVDDGEAILHKLRAATSAKAAVDQREALYQLTQLMAADVEAKMAKFIERLAWKDPVTAEPRYGPVMQDKIRALNDRVEALKLGISEISDTIVSKGEAVAQLDVQERLEEERKAALQAQLELEQTKQQAEAARIAEIERLQALEAVQAAEHAKLAEAAQKVRQDRLKMQQEEEARSEAERTALEALNNSIPFGLGGFVPALQKLEHHFNISLPGQYPKTLKTLHTFLKNICNAPENALFRHVKQSNPFYDADIGQFPGGQDAMLAMGFKIVVQDEVRVFVMEEPDLAADLDAWSNWFDTLKEMRDHLAQLLHIPL